MRGGWLAAPLITAWITACNSPPVLALDTAAVLVDPDGEARGVLAAAVSEMLHGAAVTLTEDALLHDSWLTVERVRPRTADGKLLNGRILERPEQFQLIRDQDQCVLIQRSSGRRKVLSPQLGCRAF